MYEVRIIEASKELTARERLMAKDTNNAVKIDEASRGKELIITPVAYVILGVHNTESTDGDYNQYIIEDASGVRYVTGSNAFFSSFKNIWDEMSGEFEAWSVRVTRTPSKKYSGKEFLGCSIV